MRYPLLEIEIRLFDKNKKTIKYYPKRESHSWTANHWKFIFGHCSGYPLTSADSLSLTDTGNTERAQVATSYTAYLDQVTNVKSAVNDDTQGILVGTGATAESTSDYAMDTIINDGSAAGELVYSAMSTVGFSGDKKTTQTRYFTNESGGSIVVAEVGLVYAITYSAGTLYDILMARDVLSSTITVADTEVLKVEYTVTVTFP